MQGARSERDCYVEPAPPSFCRQGRFPSGDGPVATRHGVQIRHARSGSAAHLVGGVGVGVGMGGGGVQAWGSA